MTQSASVGPIRVLHLEDSPQDATLLRRQLERAGFSLEVTLVANQEGFLRALHSERFDIILTDYNLPNWSGVAALELLRQEGKDIPCILVSGTSGEENAVECIKMGATDYVLKDRPARLPSAVDRALNDRLASDRRRLAEQARDRLALIVESSEDAIISFAADGAVLSWNRGAFRMFGYSHEEICGRPLTNIFASGNVQEVQHALGRLQRGESIENFHSAGISKDGRLIDVAVTLSAIPRLNGAMAGGSAIIRDITEHCRLEEQLRHSQKMEAVGRLAGGLAHDFNNLLTVILGYSSVLERRLGAGDTLYATVAEIRRAAEFAASLTNQLLAFSRKQVSQQSILDLNNLVLGIQTMVQRLIGEDVELRVSLDASIGFVQADPGQINQVILNLVVNARDAMPKGGTITIETRGLIHDPQDAGYPSGRPAGRYVTLTVKDTGSGMDPATMSQIFEPFFTTKEPGKGTGLGLSTVYGIVQQHRGWIDVDSKVGGGSTFTIYFPQAPEDSVASVFPATAQGISSRNGTILLVEDQAPVRMLAEVVLSDCGHRVLVAGSGAAAIEIASQQEKIDVLVTDVVMPKMSGPELAAQIGRLHPHVTVLYMSGHTDQALQNDGMIGNGAAFLQKPFLPESLIGEVNKLLIAPVAEPQP